MTAGGFAGELVELRTRCGLTQQQLAERIGVSRPYVRDLERGYRGARPSLAILERLATALGVEPDAFQAYRTAVVLNHPDWIDATYTANVTNQKRGAA